MAEYAIELPVVVLAGSFHASLIHPLLAGLECYRPGFDEPAGACMFVVR
jgi:hypothetical protein